MDDFVKLFNHSLSRGRKINREKALSIFGNGPYIGHMAYDQLTPIGFYGLIITEFTFNKEIVQIGQSVNTTILSKYRKYNLFYHLAELTNSLARKENIKFIYGLPNRPDLFHSILEWEYLGPMHKYYFHISTFPLAKICWKFFRLRPFFLWYFHIVTKRFGTNVRNLSSVKNSIDINFYNLRSERYIDQKISLGASVLSIRNTRLVVGVDYRLKIGEIEDVSLAEFDSILKKLKRLCFWLGITEICFSVDSKSDWNRIFKNKYKSVDNLQLLYYPLNDQYRLDELHITMLDYDTF